MGLERDRNNGLLKWTFHQALSSLHTRRSLVSLLQEDTSGKGMLTSPVQIWYILNNRFYKVLQIHILQSIYYKAYFNLHTYFTHSINDIAW